MTFDFKYLILFIRENENFTTIVIMNKIETQNNDVNLALIDRNFDFVISSLTTNNNIS
jgi:hypothetical protein